MKRFFSLLLALFLLGIATIALSFTVFRPGYPTERVITNEEGERLDVVIQGKVNDRLVIDRVSDERRFEIPVHKLSLTDRIFALRLPERIPPPPPEPEPEPEPKPTDPYIVNRLERIEELKERRDLIRKEIASRTLDEILHQRRTEQLAATEKEIRELELAIETYKYRTKQD